MFPVMCMLKYDVPSFHSHVKRGVIKQHTVKKCKCSGLTKCLSEKQTGKTLIRLLPEKRSNLCLCCMSKPFLQACIVFEILEHLPYGKVL